MEVIWRNESSEIFSKHKKQQKANPIMKTKFYWVALLASAALIAQAKAGGHHGGSGGGFSMAAHPAPAQRAGPGFHSAPGRNFGGGRFMAPGQRFSSYYPPMAFRQQRFGGSDRAFAPSRQFATGTRNRSNRFARFSNGGNQAITNPRGERNDAGQVRSGSNLPADWRNHVVAQHSADWQRNWDRSRDHWWHGHRCRFVDGSWFIFDFGFPWYPYGYPYDYYADDYYPYQYDSGVYEGDDGDYYGQGAYESSDEYADSTVSAAQAKLSSQGYYRGAIDGVFGPETRRAIMRYQGDHGLRVTGSLNTDTVRALGLPRVASN